MIERIWDWQAKEPPLYVWEGDIWYNEKDRKMYKANTKKMLWELAEYSIDSEKIPFPKKTRIMNENLV